MAPLPQARSFEFPLTLVEQVKAAEAQLRDAMLAGDVKALTDLLADDLVFINQIGQYLAKANYFAAHNSGRLRITQLDISDQRVSAAETFAIGGCWWHVQGFSGAFTYTRVWERADGRWRVAAARCSATAPQPSYGTH